MRATLEGERVLAAVFGAPKVWGSLSRIVGGTLAQALPDDAIVVSYSQLRPGSKMFHVA